MEAHDSETASSGSCSSSLMKYLMHSVSFKLAPASLEARSNLYKRDYWVSVSNDEKSSVFLGKEDGKKVHHNHTIFFPPVPALCVMNNTAARKVLRSCSHQARACSHNGNFYVKLKPARVFSSLRCNSSHSKCECLCPFDETFGFQRL